MEPPTHIHALPDDVLTRIFWHFEQPEPRKAIRQEIKTPLPIPPPSADAHRILLVAAVCRRWRGLTQRCVSALLVRDNLVVSRQALASAVAALPNLTHLHLCDGSVETLDDAFLAHHASSCPNLAILHVGSRITPVDCIRGYDAQLGKDEHPPITEAGLDRFFRQSTRLEQLALYCHDPSVEFPASFFQLPRLHTLALTHASPLEAPDLSNLSSLTSLHFPSGDINYEQVASVARLPRITTLSISDEASVYRGDGFARDFDMAQMPLLKSLQFVQMLPAASPCTSLERLEIVNKNLIGHLDKLSPDLLTYQLGKLMPSLRELSLRQRFAAEYVPGHITTLPVTSLTVLESLTLFECNRLSSLPEEIGCLHALKTLVLHRLPLVALPDSLCHLPSLETFFLIECITSRQLLQLPADFCCLTSLQSLAILRMPRVRLPENIGELPRLHTLYHVADLPDVSMLPWLRKLSLKLVGAEERMGVSSSLARVKQLELALQEEAVELPFSLALLPQLHTLVMWNAGKMQRLPSDMGWAVPQLRVLQIHCARELRELPDSIGAASRLRQLHLFDCPALHHLPASLAQLACLHELHVENSGLRCLPSGIAQFTRLRSLSLHGCVELQGLPDDLTELKMLQYLGIKNCSKDVWGGWDRVLEPRGLQSRSMSSSSFYGSRLHAKPSSLPAQRNAGGAVSVRADMWKKLGGRGLIREDILKSDKANEVLWNQPVRPAKDTTKEKLPIDKELVEGFDKELDGLTGGFPGGEKGLAKFLKNNPLPAKYAAASSELANVQKRLSEAAAAAASSVPKPLAPPLLMPGMTVKVINPKDAYYQFSGIVQRLTDGNVAVLFEGGNWDKLVTFRLSELERTKKGPPGSNPKSASLQSDPAFQK
ncbi:unnamed protein product [Closterium sp. Naga37s-1]|nr:unnamed protein product [Closterium sp. Naga37s-1]